MEEREQMKVKSQSQNGKTTLPPNVKHRKAFAEPVRDWYCDAKGCLEEFESRLKVSDEREYKFCLYHVGVIVHNLVEQKWAPLQEVLDR